MNDVEGGTAPGDDPDDEQPDIEDDGIVVDLDPGSEANRDFI